MLSASHIYPQISPTLNAMYGIDERNYSVWWNNENLVLWMRESVVRITPPEHRSEWELSAELELISILHRHWCSVVEIINSQGWNLCEGVRVSTWQLYMTVFRKLRWVNPKIIDTGERRKMVKEWGRTIGEIHRVSSQNHFIHKNNRLVWDHEIIITNAQDLLPEGDWAIFGELQSILESLRWVSMSSENYWLVHTDMRPRNFAYEDGKVTHFDFDDICHHWFIYDIAVAALHETEEFKTAPERTKFLKDFLWDIIKGYLAEKSIPKEMLKLVVLFMKLRCVYAYIDYFKRLKIKNVDSGKEKMEIRRGYILDFNTFIDTANIENYLLENYA